MSKRFFIADTHFGDRAIIEFEGRPFKSIKEMSEILVDNWNSVVSEEDVVYILGDFIEISSKIKYEDIIKDLNGELVLIAGNHDKNFLDTYVKLGIEVIDYPIILDNFWILSHEPMYVNTKSPYANIFGHIHNNPMYKTVSSRSFCVSAERINYTPISFEEIKRQVYLENEKEIEKVRKENE